VALRRQRSARSKLRKSGQQGRRRYARLSRNMRGRSLVRQIACRVKVGASCKYFNSPINSPEPRTKPRKCKTPAALNSPTIFSQQRIDRRIEEHSKLMKAAANSTARSYDLLHSS
jgi:hypothetical protein